MAIVPGKWDEMSRDEYGDARALYGGMNTIMRMAASNKDNPVVLKACAKQLEDIEYHMQSFWGFDKDSNYHRYWYKLPGCTCPQLDNDDLWGTGHRIYSADCPIHG